MLALPRGMLNGENDDFAGLRPLCNRPGKGIAASPARTPSTVRSPNWKANESERFKDCSTHAQCALRAVLMNIVRDADQILGRARREPEFIAQSGGTQPRPRRQTQTGEVGCASPSRTAEVPGSISSGSPALPVKASIARAISSWLSAGSRARPGALFEQCRHGQKISRAGAERKCGFLLDDEPFCVGLSARLEPCRPSPRFCCGSSPWP